MSRDLFYVYQEEDGSVHCEPYSDDVLPTLDAVVAAGVFKAVIGQLMESDLDPLVFQSAIMGQLTSMGEPAIDAELVEDITNETSS